MKFMWIPGRKKHNHKGQYSTTKEKHQPYKASNVGGQKQRKQEVWSMGGSRGQRQLINTDTDDFLSATTSSTALGVVANGAAIAASTSKTVHDGPDCVAVDKNGDCVCDEQQGDSKEELKNLDKQSYHDAATLVLGDKNKKSPCGSDDLDSIEQLGDSNLNLHEPELDEIDVTDTASTHNLHMKKRRRNKRKKSKKVDETRPEDDKLIACLYYSLVCCDCTIS